MKRILLTPAIALVGGLFVASLAMGAVQQQRILLAQTELGVGTASGESHEVVMESQELSKMQVQKMQKMLNEKGHMAGPEDGIMGPKTKKALSEFQTSQGLPATGKPDMETMKALGMGDQPQEIGVGSASGEGKQ
jgi:peptidoglycan hydrolase-like protein with peptidoglycan-binding domain